jgi:hypothetical protein
MNHTCDICDTQISHAQNILKHKRTEKCQYIKKLLDKRDNYNSEKNKIIQKENEEFKIKISKLLDENNYKDVIIKNLEEKAEEYRQIIEKSTSLALSSKHIFIPRDNELRRNKEQNFEIDIVIDNKQLNRTKYKDVPEEVVKKDIQSLKLKDNYQLEYRNEDGFINITNLCKAGGKKFNDWNRLDKTKRFLDVLKSETGIPVSDLIKVGSGSKYENDTKNQTWSHLQIAINIAQWISPEFDVMVSRLVYQIILTGKMDIRDNKTTKELDEMNKENKLLKNKIKLLESKTLQKQKREVFENDKNAVYVITTEYKEAQGHYKIGKTKDLKNRLSTLNTSDKHEVIYYTSCKDKESMDLLEKLVHKKLNSKRIEPNKEWFLSEEEAEDFIKIIEECKNVNDL